MSEVPRKTWLIKWGPTVREVFEKEYTLFRSEKHAIVWCLIE